jgi:predicted dehydrogenase
MGPVSPSPEPRKSDRLRVVIVGFGKMGILHGALARATGLAEVVGIVEESAKVSKAVTNMFGHRVSVLRDTDGVQDLAPNAVYITTPIASHYDVIVDALEGAVKGVFVEKTLSNDATKSRTLAERTAARGITSAVGYQKRFVATFSYLKKLLDDEILGDVEKIDAYAYSEDFLGFMHHAADSVAEFRGGVLRDLGSHAIDLVLWLLECRNPRIVHAEFLGPYDEIRLAFLANKTNVVVSTSRCKPGYRTPEVGLEITCSKGRIFASDDELEMQKGCQQQKIRRVEFAERVHYLLASPEYYVENEAFLESVLRRGDFRGANFEEASAVDEIIGKGMVFLHDASGRR